MLRTRTILRESNEDSQDGEIMYETFSSGISHGSQTILNLPAQETRIEAVNKDYSQRVNLDLARK